MAVSLTAAGLPSPAAAQTPDPAESPSAIPEVSGEVADPPSATPNPDADPDAGAVAGEDSEASAATVPQGDESHEDLSRVTALVLEEERTGIRQEGDGVVDAQQLGDPSGPVLLGDAGDVTADLSQAVVVGGKSAEGTSDLVIDEAAEEYFSLLKTDFK